MTVPEAAPPAGAPPTQRSDADRLVRERIRSSVTSSVVFTPLILVLSTAGSLVVARALGPALYAVIAAVAGVGATITAFADIGITKSMPKILNDLGVRFGRATAVRAQRKLATLLYTLFLLGWVVIVLLDELGGPSVRRGLGLDQWFLALVGIRIVLSGASIIVSGIATASLQNSLIYRTTLIQSLVNPVLTVAAAIITHDPYTVVLVSFVADVLYVGILYRSSRLDLDGDAPLQPVRFRGIAEQYGTYIGVTYLKYLFARFVVGLPLILWTLTALHVGAAEIGNASLAVSIAAQIWTIADMPMAQVQAPLLSRLFAAGDEDRFRRTQRAMVAVVVVSSALCAIGMASLGTPTFSLLYGHKYHSGVDWGVRAAMLAISVNYFSLGNRTLQQRNRFGPQILALIVSVIAVAVSFAACIHFLPRSVLPLAVVLTVIGARGLFWFITDLWTEAEVFQWDGFEVKLRGLAAIAPAIAIILVMNRLGLAERFAGAVLGTACFFAIFRMLGGIGADTRATLKRFAGAKLAWIASLC